MTRDPATLIEEWFLTHNGDGEFYRPDSSTPYTVITPSKLNTQIVFCTKPAIVSRLFDGNSPSDVTGIIGRCGLPYVPDLRWVRRIAGGRRIVFLGDMDPVDLMIFAWLRIHLTHKRIAFLGIGDVLLKCMRLPLSSTNTIPLAPSEGRAVGHLAVVLPKFHHIIGPKCSRLIKGGYKVEVEALMGSGSRTGRALRRAIARLG